MCQLLLPLLYKRAASLARVLGIKEAATKQPASVDETRRSYAT